MPRVNWDAFAQLPGSAENNFEMLCRGLVRRHYARCGEFRALAAQPGVEFHLKLQAPCPLGDPGRWYGWQCRWYDLPGGRALGTTRRKKIAKAISLTEEVLPELTDWVLWTRRTLTAGDQKWFFGLKTHMRRHLWTAADVEDLLSGDAEILRATYFGELILTPETLGVLHDVSVAPIRRRWNPAVHQTIKAERELRRMLGEPGTWDDLRAFAQQLESESKAVHADLIDLPEQLEQAALEVASGARAVAAALADGYTALERGDLDMLRQQVTSRPTPLGARKLAAVPRRLRAYRHRAALSVTNALADTHRAHDLLDEIETYPSMRVVGVLAEAGCGKTELAAQLTSAVNTRPPGILLHGRDLGASHSLDDLAHSIVIQGVPVASMDALMAAVDAAGQRAHRRLPVVIDGLNEAEDSRTWKAKLAALDQMLLPYPYVLVVCTLRTAFADDALPPDVPRLHIPDFQQDTGKAIRRYFEYYRINASDAELPWELLRHPLTLALFCEVTNPRRERPVGVEAMPGSLSSLFDRYLERASERVIDLSPVAWRYYGQDVRAALDEIGWSLWQERTRSLDLVELRRQLGDDGRPWNGSIVRALEQEGVLLRGRERGLTTDHITAVYDALAGHLVADAVLRKYGRTGLEEWLREPATVTALAGPLHDQHPLGTDILGALVGLLPRRLHQQLWPLLQEPLRTTALIGAAHLEAANLDTQTVRELATLTVQPPSGSRELLDRLWRTRGSPTHPLNSDFLDAVVRPMSVAQRDLRWTEWVRRRGDELVKDLEAMERRWHTLGERSRMDRLRAQWVMWTLTSTAPKIRDQATRTLYWFGRGEAAALFSLTLNALSINDGYVPERLLAASYGVVMAHQLPDGEFEKALREFLVGLHGALAGPSATHPTNHWLARLYVQGCVTLALAYHPAAISNGLHVNGRVPFALGPTIDRIEPGDSRAAEVDHALNMHYDDDTLSEFVGFRRSYDRKNRGEHPAVAHLRGTLWTLGWRESGLGVIDKDIRSADYRRHSVQAQRYASKYAWIGLYCYTGMLDHYRLIWHGRRPPDVQIDPSFPEPTPPASISIPEWAGPTPADDRCWIREGIVTVPDELFYLPEIGSHSGPWIAVRGYLSSRTKVPDRGVFGFLYSRA
jgi:hypothetical protein